MLERKKRWEINVENNADAWAVLEAARVEANKAAELKRRDDQLNTALLAISPRYRNKTFADFTVNCKEQAHIKQAMECYVATFSERLREAASLIFIGRPGTGKTLMALIIYQALARAGYSVEYRSSLNFLRLLQEKQFESYSSLDSLLKHYQQLSFLIVDEVTEGCGKCATPADWERHLLRMVIDARYQAGRPTLVLSNRRREELLERIGEPALDRLAERGATLAFSWQSYRQ
jgi:DNA replication protein DnaC